MGSLVPGCQYVYEREGNKVYARVFGGEERHVIGHTMSDSSDLFARHFTKWNDLLLTAESNLALREKLEELLQLYELVKKHE